MYRGIFTLLLLVAPSAHAESSAALFGAAAMTASVMPAVVGGIQSSADQNIAALDANTQMYLTNSNNNLSYALGSMQMGTPLALAGMQATVASYANQQSTFRQWLQTTAMAQANALNAQMQMQQTQADYGLKFAALALQNRTLDYQFRAAMAAGGLLPTFQLKSDGDRLQVRSYGLAAAGTSSGTPGQPILTTTPGTVSSVSRTATQAASSRLLSALQSAAPALAAVRVAVTPAPARIATEPFRGLASAMVSESAWVRHTPKSEALFASEPEVVGSGHKPR